MSRFPNLEQTNLYCHYTQESLIIIWHTCCSQHTRMLQEHTSKAYLLLSANNIFCKTRPLGIGWKEHAYQFSTFKSWNDSSGNRNACLQGRLTGLAFVKSALRHNHIIVCSPLGSGKVQTSVTAWSLNITVINPTHSSVPRRLVFFDMCQSVTWLPETVLMDLLDRNIWGWGWKKKHITFDYNKQNSNRGYLFIVYYQHNKTLDDVEFIL